VVGFNPYAAFPSVHLLWALIPVLCLAVGSGRAWVWLIALCYPLAMTVTIIATGNHYVLDCLGSAVLLALSTPLVWATARLRRRVRRMPPQVRYELPAALSLCLVCVGILGRVGGSGSVRPLVVLGVLLLLGLPMGGSRYLWRGRRLAPGRQPVWATDYLAGLLFLAGATAAAPDPGPDAVPAIGACALLWVLACLCAVLRHLWPAAQAPQQRQRGHGYRRVERHDPHPGHGQPALAQRDGLGGGAGRSVPRRLPPQPCGAARDVPDPSAVPPARAS
jgi:hypothetical protein